MKLQEILRNRGQKAKGIGRAGIVSETKLAKRIKAKPTPASGALSGAKGDMFLDEFLIEAKSTSRASMSIKLDWLCKILGEARAKQLNPAVSIVFSDEDGDPRRSGKWMMIQEHTFMEMISGDKISKD